MASIVIFLIGIGIGYALARLILYSYMKWQEKHGVKETISHQDMLYGSWEYSIFYGVLLVLFPLNSEWRVWWFIVFNFVWFVIVIIGEYMRQGKKQLKRYEEEIRNGNDLPVNEMSLPEINFWIKTLTKDKRKLERLLKGAKKNDFKKIIKDTEKALKDINNDLKVLKTAKIKAKSGTTKTKSTS